MMKAKELHMGSFGNWAV